MEHAIPTALASVSLCSLDLRALNATPITLELIAKHVCNSFYYLLALIGPKIAVDPKIARDTETAMQHWNVNAILTTTAPIVAKV